MPHHEPLGEVGYRGNSDEDWAWEIEASHAPLQRCRDRNGPMAVFRRIPALVRRLRDGYEPADPGTAHRTKGLVLVTGPTEAEVRHSPPSRSGEQHRTEQHHHRGSDRVVHKGKKCLSPSGSRLKPAPCERASSGVRRSRCGDGGELRDLLETISIALETAETATWSSDAAQDHGAEHARRITKSSRRSSSRKIRVSFGIVARGWRRCSAGRSAAGAAAAREVLLSIPACRP